MTERRIDRHWTMQVTALYDYEPEQSDELRFEEGDVLRVVHVQDDGWWSGFNVEEPDVVGLFPSNYVQAQRTAKSSVDLVRNSRQRIQQQPQQATDIPELEEESVDIVQELRSEFRGHAGTVLQLRKNLENAERAREAVRDARRQAERERLRHRKSWREREQDEGREVEVKYSQANPQQQEAVPVDGEDTDDEDDSAFPHVQGSVHEVDQLEGEEDVEEAKPHMPAIETQSDVENNAIEIAVRAAAVVIARNYRRHAAIVQRKQSLEREAEQHREVAAVCIQRWAAHAQSRQRRRRQVEQNTARRRCQLENGAASAIQKWIRLRWACFWRTRVQVDREQRAVREAQEIEETRRQEELEQQRRQEAEIKQQLAHIEKERRALEEQQRQKLQDDAQQLQLKKVVEEEVQRRFQEEENGQHDVGPAVISPGSQAGKTRRKVMKKEAVELIKTLVQQQLGETLRDHDTKMDELQRMVSRLQTVVRKQTTMLEDSTDELVALQMQRQEQQLPQRRNDAGGYSLLPRISAPRQPMAPSGLRAPRPVMLSKLPVIANGVRGSGFNHKKV
ncbi:hypothetical protein DVH05_003181 [Phytophthora capsici]|nr:hypothetical protein DVH05_003181 [Phytophthora capsici]